MNRPEPIELENNLGPDAVTGEINRVPWKAYDIDEVDAILAEKDKEIRSLRRALYKACANWAIFRACILEYFCIKINAKKWERMYHRCRAKAEEYK